LTTLLITMLAVMGCRSLFDGQQQREAERLIEAALGGLSVT
jgi:hypothetical protein